MRAARKLKVNMNRKSIALHALLNQVLLVEAHPTKREVLILTLRLLLRNPGQNGLKYNSSWWQLLRGLRMHWRNPHNKGSIRVREGTVRALVPAARDLNSKVTAKTVVQPKTIKLWPGGVILTRSNAIIARAGGMRHEGKTQQNLPQHLGWTQNLHQCQCQTLPNKHSFQFSTPNPIAAIELIGRVNEADISVGDIWVTALINTRAQVSTITQEFCKQHGYDANPVKQMLHLEGMGRSPFHTWGTEKLLLGTLQSRTMMNASQCLSSGPPHLLVQGSLSSWVPLTPAICGNRAIWILWSQPE